MKVVLALWVSFVYLQLMMFHIFCSYFYFSCCVFILSQKFYLFPPNCFSCSQSLIFSGQQGSTRLYKTSSISLSSSSVWTFSTKPAKLSWADWVCWVSCPSSSLSFRFTLSLLQSPSCQAAPNAFTMGGGQNQALPTRSSNSLRHGGDPGLRETRLLSRAGWGLRGHLSWSLRHTSALRAVLAHLIEF